MEFKMVHPGHNFDDHHLNCHWRTKNAKCSICDKNNLSPAYGCTSCKFALCDLCVSLPEEIQHPFHPEHNLTLQASRWNKCGACGGRTKGLIYGCSECGKFRMGYECAPLKPTVKYDEHEHLLTFFMELGSKHVCDKCGVLCKTCVLRCMQCDFDLHMGCFPPYLQTVPYKHIHPLTLTEFVGEDDLHNYYCDGCETTRKPEHPVYNCEECKFVAHMDCVVPAHFKIPAREEVKQYATKVDSLESKTKYYFATNTITLANIMGEIKFRGSRDPTTILACLDKKIENLSQVLLSMNKLQEKHSCNELFLICLNEEIARIEKIRENLKDKRVEYAELENLGKRSQYVEEIQSLSLASDFREVCRHLDLDVVELLAIDDYSCRSITEEYVTKFIRYSIYQSSNDGRGIFDYLGIKIHHAETEWENLIRFLNVLGRNKEIEEKAERAHIELLEAHKKRAQYVAEFPLLCKAVIEYLREGDKKLEELDIAVMLDDSDDESSKPKIPSRFTRFREELNEMERKYAELMRQSNSKRV